MLLLGCTVQELLFTRQMQSAIPGLSVQRHCCGSLAGSIEAVFALLEVHRMLRQPRCCIKEIMFLNRAGFCMGWFGVLRLAHLSFTLRWNIFRHHSLRYFGLHCNESACALSKCCSSVIWCSMAVDEPNTAQLLLAIVYSERVWLQIRAIRYCCRQSHSSLRVYGQKGARLLWLHRCVDSVVHPQLDFLFDFLSSAYRSAQAGRDHTD